jgi:hypothetical protein
MRSSFVFRLFVLLASLVFPRVLAAQTVQIGNNLTSVNANDIPVASVRTDIDLVQPATAAGTVDSASFFWNTGPCPDEVKIKFFRRQGDTLVFLDERGPFTADELTTTVALTPPVPVQQGDLIGISRLAECGELKTLTGIVSPGYAAYAGDVTSNVSLSGRIVGDRILAVYATGTATESVAGVLAAAGSTPGNFGSFFKTGVQLYNPGSSAIAGRFVYHPASVPGSSADPSLSFSVGAGAAVSYDDLVASMGQTGLGSIDVVLPEPTPLHVLVARIYNDAGAAGTSGFTEEEIDSDSSSERFSRILFAGATAFLVAPSDVAHFRFNIGVRSLLSGAVITFTQRDASGVLVRTVTKTYQPTFYEQQSAETFLGGPLGANDSIQASVSGGSAIVYGATVDNTTQDPSIQFARVIFAIASADGAGSADGNGEEFAALVEAEEKDPGVAARVESSSIC